VAFFVWIAALGECLMIANLRKKKVWILGWCYICKCNGESVDHLFPHCKNCRVTVYALVSHPYPCKCFL